MPMMTTINDASGELQNDIHILPVRVYHEDTDYTGVVYHASYLRFAERGRSDMLGLLGVHHDALYRMNPPLALMVYRMEIDFLGTARIAQLLHVETRLKTLSRTRIVLSQTIRRQAKELWLANVTIIAAVPGGRAKRLPQQILHAFSRWNESHKVQETARQRIN